MAHAGQTGSGCGDNATVATTEVWRCANGPGGCGVATDSCWSHQSRCLTQSEDPQWQPPCHPSFCSLFKRFLLAPLPLHPPRSILQPYPRTRCWWGSTAQALETWQVSPGAPPRAPRVCCSAEALSHPLPGKDLAPAPGTPPSQRPLGHDSLQNKKPTATKKKKA